jgi:NADPH:quinone reductase-like Zn-dependent oxidoreductase
MRGLVVFGSKGSDPARPDHRTILVDDMIVRSAVIEMAEPTFDSKLPKYAGQVLIKVAAFTCNYRDKGFLSALQRCPPNQFFAVGSEFVGRIVDIGVSVSGFKIGDRVIPNNHYDGFPQSPTGVRHGLPTNQASREFLVISAHQLSRIPDSMSDSEAAGFSIGAQTAYSMVRRLAPRAGANVLVPSASSNTSLFLIGALRNTGATIHASTTTKHADERLRAAGAHHVVHVGGDAGTFRDGSVIEAYAASFGGFDQVFDPFFDLHLERAVSVLAPFGSYITCGLAGQTSAVQSSIPKMVAEPFLVQVMSKNLSVIGNCLGLREDLDRALLDYSSGRMTGYVDSTHSGDRSAEFLDRTFNNRQRIGKVVFAY